MQCPKCKATMSHHYCESWTGYIDEYGDEVEYVTMKGYWSCDASDCPTSIGEDDDDYFEPKDE